MSPIYQRDELTICPGCGKRTKYRRLTSEFFMIVSCIDDCGYDASYDVLDEEDS